VVYRHAYDLEGRQVCVGVDRGGATACANGAASALGTVFVYDGDGRLAARLVDGVLETAYAAGGRYEREVAQGRATSYYALGGTTVAMRRAQDGAAAGTVHYLHQDHLGSTTLQTGGDPSAALPPLSRVEGQQLRGPYGQPWLAQTINGWRRRSTCASRLSSGRVAAGGWRG
jgi:hypothetical protein